MHIQRSGCSCCADGNSQVGDPLKRVLFGVLSLLIIGVEIKPRCSRSLPDAEHKASKLFERRAYEDIL
jgi:hypothetical protein